MITEQDLEAAAAAKDRMEAAEGHLSDLADKMQDALKAHREGKTKRSERLLREIVQTEPRLAEPRLELAHIAAGRADWTEAREQARLAVEVLRAGGQWTTDLEPGEVLGFALNLLGEVIVRDLDDAERLRDEEEFHALWNEAAHAFDEARRADPTSADALRNATRYRPIDDR